MILFENKNADLESLLKDAMLKVVCRECKSKTCTDPDGHQCDLVNPIVVEVKRTPEGKMSCRGCKHDRAGLICHSCCRWYDDETRYKDLYEEEQNDEI